MKTRSQKVKNLSITIRMVILLCFFVFSNASDALTTRTLRVGVYDNPPKLLLNDHGQISGILGDILTTIATREKWHIVPVSCDWDQCLNLLKQGEIDLMPDVAYSDKRASLYQFHSVPALRSWSQIYTTKAQTISSLLDLDDKRIAVLNGSIQQKYLAEMADSFGLHVNWILVNTMDQGFDDVVKGRADVVAANNLFGDLKAQQYNLTDAPVLFQPAKLYFAAPLHQNTDILSRIDFYLAQWKATPDSVYYQILHRWINPTYNKQIPKYVWWGIALLTLLICIILFFNWMLRRQVAEKTQRLTESEIRLNTILDSVDANIYIKDMDLRYQYANQKLAQLVGMQPSQIIGKTDLDLFDKETSKNMMSNDARVVEFCERVAVEESIKIREQSRTFYSVKLPLRQSGGGVIGLCGISTDMTEHQQIQQQLYKLAFYDPLTGLANRRSLLESLRNQLIQNQQNQSEGAVLLIDIDGFKTLNESMGHDSGDTVLKLVAVRLQQLLGEDAVLARLGSDEFVVVIEALNEDHKIAVLKLNSMADTLIQQLEKPYPLADINYVISSSIGIALFSDAAGSVEKLLQYVDLALHRAKETGRGSIRFFNQDMQSEVKRRNYLESALREAIEYKRLELHVQPQFNSQGLITGMEALTRWHDRQLGMVSPAEFIPLAEETGLIVPLGEWVMRQASQILALWRELPSMNKLTLAINLSAKQFRHPAFLENVKAILQEYAVDPTRLEFEITESLLIDDLVNTIERMKHLSSLGIQFSLDDFGTGYASLSYLKALPLHKLKIDQSFVRDMMSDPNDEAIISTIISLGNSLELEVIAEGVETKEQAERLQQMGCHVYQGYLFGKPESVEHWQQVLSRQE